MKYVHPKQTAPLVIITLLVLAFLVIFSVVPAKPSTVIYSGPKHRGSTTFTFERGFGSVRLVEEDMGAPVCSNRSQVYVEKQGLTTRIDVKVPGPNDSITCIGYNDDFLLEMFSTRYHTYVISVDGQEVYRD